LAEGLSALGTGSLSVSEPILFGWVLAILSISLRRHFFNNRVKLVQKATNKPFAVDYAMVKVNF
jgi:hypothetical protein